MSRFRKKPQNINQPVADKPSNTFNIINLIIAVGALVVAVLAIRNDTRIAERSGAFDKGDLHFRFAGYDVPPDSTYEVYYGINFNDSNVHLSFFPAGIYNAGKKDVEDINILIKYPRIMNVAVTDTAFKLSTLNDKIQRKTLRNKPFDEILLSVSSLSPSSSENLSDLINLKETSTRTRFAALTKDSVPVNGNAEVSYSYDVFVRATASNSAAQQYSFLMHHVNTNNPDSLLQKIIDQKLNAEGERGSTRSFIIITPDKQENIGTEKYPIMMHEPQEKNIILCKFTTDMDALLLINRQGEIDRVYDISRREWYAK